MPIRWHAPVPISDSLAMCVEPAMRWLDIYEIKEEDVDEIVVVMFYQNILIIDGIKIQDAPIEHVRDLWLHVEDIVGFTVSY